MADLPKIVGQCDSGARVYLVHTGGDGRSARGRIVDAERGEVLGEESLPSFMTQSPGWTDPGPTAAADADLVRRLIAQAEAGTLPPPRPATI